MKIRAVAYPSASPGLEVVGEDQVQPDQNMSLAELIEKFVRGESLDIGADTFGSDIPDEEFDNPLMVDIEKMSQADLVDKAEYVQRLKDVQTQFEKQEKARLASAADAQAKADEAALQKKIRIEARKLQAKESSKTLA